MRQPQSLGDGEGMARAREADLQVVGRAERLEVEFDRGIARRGHVVRVCLELGVVRRRRDEGAGSDEVVEERLRQRGSFRRVGARAQLVEQDQAVRPGRLDDAHDRAHVARERRERLGDRLLVADVGEDVAEDGQPTAFGRRDVETGLMHQGEQAEGAQCDGLAAGVRAGDDERRVAVAEPQVDGHDLVPERPGWRAPSSSTHRVASSGRRADPVHLRGEARAGAPEVEVGQRREVLARGAGAAVPDERRELVEDALLLGLDGQLRLAPGVAELDHGERLDEERLTAARLVVDDASDAALGLGTDGDDVAAVAQGDDGLLERAGQLRPVDEVLEARAEPLVGHAHVAPQPTEGRRGRCRATRRTDRGSPRAGHGCAAAAGGVAPRSWSSGAPLLGQCVAQARDRLEGDHHVDELERIQSTRPGGTLDGRADVPGAADADARPLGEQGSGLVGLVQPATDEDRVGARFDRLRQAARGRKARGGGQPFADRWRTRGAGSTWRPRAQLPAGNGRESADWPRRPNRRGSSAHGWPA